MKISESWILGMNRRWMTLTHEQRDLALTIQRAAYETRYLGPASMFGLSLALGGAAALQRTSAHSVTSAVGIALRFRDGNIAERWLWVKLGL